MRNLSYHLPLYLSLWQNEVKKNRPWPDDTGEIVYGEEKVSALVLHM